MAEQPANITPARPGLLVPIETACRWLAEAKNVDAVKELRDQAQVFEHYARERGYGLQAQNDGAEIKIRAERRLGELIPEQFPHGGDRKSESRLQSATLKNLGIDKFQSHRWQRTAGVPVEDFEQHIALVRERGEELTSAGVLRLAKHLEQPGKKEHAPQDGCTVADLQTLIDQGKQYQTIYADPPWQYGNQATRAATDNHYQTMTAEEIATLPIEHLADEQSHLWLWTTHSFMGEALAIIKAWGFEYKSQFVWCKPQMGLGNYLRIAHELLFLGVRGGLRFPEDARNIMSWEVMERGEHSVKPDRVRTMIERASPAPRLELFGRRAVPGWAVWGNQVERDLFTQQLEAI